MNPKNQTRSDTPAGTTAEADELRKQDRIASTGDDYAHDNNASAEGNDASLIAGPTFTRRINADGTVQAVPADGGIPSTAAGTAEAADLPESAGAASEQSEDRKHR